MCTKQGVVVLLDSSRYKKNQLQTKLFQAAKSGDVNSMQKLIMEGADPYEPDKSGKTPLYHIKELDPPELLDNYFIRALARFTHIIEDRDEQNEIADFVFDQMSAYSKNGGKK